MPSQHNARSGVVLAGSYGEGYSNVQRNNGRYAPVAAGFEWRDPKLCTAMKTDGTECSAFHIDGSSYCRIHHKLIMSIGEGADSGTDAG